MASSQYKAGFSTEIDNAFILKKGLDEDTIKTISNIKNEPKWLLDFRLKAFQKWKGMKEPKWANLKYEHLDYQNISYYSSPKNPFTNKNINANPTDQNWEEDIDPKILETFKKLGIPLEEQKRLSGVAVDAVIDSISVKTTFKKELKKLGIIFCSFSEAVKNHPDLIQKYFNTVVPYSDNFFACLNSAVFSDGSFAYIPPDTKCPMELSTYFRINSMGTGQFERTLVIADKNSYVSYLEGCTAPQYSDNQLHAAVVELIALDNAEIKYSTIQNWYPGNMDGKGGVYNFVTKRGLCQGNNSKISWTQLETGSAITWKYPSCILKGDNSSGDFYSVAVTNNYQQADTGTKMIHIGKNTKSKIISKGISNDYSKNTYRGLVKMIKNSGKAKNFTQCDSLILSNKSQAITIPTIENSNPKSVIEHEATTSKLDLNANFYLQTRGQNPESAKNFQVHGFTREVMKNLPLEFAIEGKKLLEISMEGSVG